MDHHVLLIHALRGGQRGWLLKWRDFSSGVEGGVRLSYWFVDQEEATAVRDGMRQGLSFDEAFRQMWMM